MQLRDKAAEPLLACALWDLADAECVAQTQRRRLVIPVIDTIIPCRCLLLPAAAAAAVVAIGIIIVSFIVIHLALLMIVLLFYC